MVGTPSVTTRETVGIECVATENSRSREGDVKKQTSPFLVHVDSFQKQKERGDDRRKKIKTCTEPGKRQMMTSLICFFITEP